MRILTLAALLLISLITSADAQRQTCTTRCYGDGGDQTCYTYCR